MSKPVIANKPSKDGKRSEYFRSETPYTHILYDYYDSEKGRWSKPVRLTLKTARELHPDLFEKFEKLLKEINAS